MNQVCRVTAYLYSPLLVCVQCTVQNETVSVCTVHRTNYFNIITLAKHNNKLPDDGC